MLFILSRADFIMKEAGIAGLIKANKSRLKRMSHFLLTYHNIVWDPHISNIPYSLSPYFCNYTTSIISEHKQHLGVLPFQTALSHHTK